MKFFLILLISLSFMPIFAQDLNVTDQLMNNEDKSRTTDRLNQLENDTNTLISKIDALQNSIDETSIKFDDFQQKQSAEPITLLVIGTFILAGASIIGIVVSSRKMSSQVSHMKEQNRIYEKDIDERILLQIFEMLSDLKFRSARKTLYKCRRNYENSTISDEDQKVKNCYFGNSPMRDAVDLVKTSFGLVAGLLFSNRHLLSRVFDLYGDTIHLSWNSTEPAILWYRRVNDDQRHMIHFKWLFDECEKWYEQNNLTPPTLN